ncbi:MAG: hypothetical protein ABI895_24770 [Deltaproteobacteria bacterium]
MFSALPATVVNARDVPGEAGAIEGKIAPRPSSLAQLVHGVQAPRLGDEEAR